MKKLALTLALTLSVAMMGGCTSTTNETAAETTATQVASEAAVASDVAATVNGTEISLKDFDKTYLFTSQNYIMAYGGGDREMLNQEVNGTTFGDLLKEQVINSMVVDDIVSMKLAADGIEASQEEIDQTYNNFKKYELDNNEELKKFLEENDLDEAFIKDRIKKQILITKYSEGIRQPLMDNIDFTTEEYAGEVAKVSAKHILVQKEDEAKKVIERLKKGEAFETLAEELSQDKGSAVNGGDLGYFWRGVMIQAFEDAAFDLEVGGISEPVQTQFGYHIIKTEDKQTYSDLLETPEGQVELESKKSELVQAEFDNIYRKAITDMMAENDVVINYSALGITPFEQVEQTTESTTK